MAEPSSELMAWWTAQVCTDPFASECGDEGCPAHGEALTKTYERRNPRG